MVHFIGAGPGAPDLITVRGQKLLGEADIIIYAGSLVNPALLDLKKEGCVVYNSATMTLEQVIDVMKEAESKGQTVARLHTGDPCLYGAIREQIEVLATHGIQCEICPGVSSFLAAAAALNCEYTVPEVSQTVILTRMEGRTPVPEKEKLSLLAQHGASMAVFLSAGHLKELQEQLCEGAYTPDTPCAIVYKASWAEQQCIKTTIKELEQKAREAGITKTALVLVGDFLGEQYAFSKLYDPEFQTEYRK